jgi:hypothetical protein
MFIARFVFRGLATQEATSRLLRRLFLVQTGSINMSSLRDEIIAFADPSLFPDSRSIPTHL